MGPLWPPPHQFAVQQGLKELAREEIALAVLPPTEPSVERS